MKIRVKRQNLGQTICGLIKENVRPNISLILRKGIIVELSRVISELELKEGEIIRNEEQILLEIENYFTNLYSSKIDVSQEQFGLHVEHLYN